MTPDGVIGLITIGLIILVCSAFVLAACMLSSRISQEEEGRARR